MLFRSSRVASWRMSQKFAPITAPPSSTLRGASQPVADAAQTSSASSATCSRSMSCNRNPMKIRYRLVFLSDQSKSLSAPTKPPIVNASVNSGAVFR